MLGPTIMLNTIFYIEFYFTIINWLKKSFVICFCSLFDIEWERFQSKSKPFTKTENRSVRKYLSAKGEIVRHIRNSSAKSIWKGFDIA